MAPEPYTISVSQEKIDNLKTKLSLAEFPDELDAAGWDLGAPLADLKRLTKAWEQWDWRPAEERLNKLPQYHTGPGSFIEVVPLLESLSRGSKGPAFTIIAPSLPNYGFSSGPSTRGFGLTQYAETCHKLMLSLGYNEYVTQGGDWGFYITRALGALYPEHVKASHINMIRASPPKLTANPIQALRHNLAPYTDKEKAGFERTKWFAEEGRGYFYEQATKPQTLAYALNDSPVALLAWIYEKLHDWTDQYPWTDDEILTWVSIYQFSRMGPGAAHRIYYEVVHTQPGEGKVTRDEVQKWIGVVKLGLGKSFIGVKPGYANLLTWAAFNPKELSVIPKSWGRTLGPVVFESENDAGGHFYATEKPDLLARDLRKMFGRGGGAFGVVKGKNGYDDTKAKL